MKQRLDAFVFYIACKIQSYFSVAFLMSLNDPIVGQIHLEG